MNAFRTFEEAGWRHLAAAYDRMIGHITGRVAGPLLDAARVTTGTRMLDLACGPGYAAAAAARRGAVPVGVDLSPAMVALARYRHPGLDFREASAEALPFASSRFDAVVGNFVLPHLSEPEVVVGECVRVLKPGGRLALSAWDRPERARFVGVLVEAIAEVGPPPPADLPDGPPFFRYADTGEIGTLLTGAGLADVTVTTMAFEHHLASADELWDGLLDGTVRTSALVAGQSAETREMIRASFNRRLAPYTRPDGLVMPVSVVLARGTTPRS